MFQWNYKFDEEAADDSLTTTQSKNTAIDEDDCLLVYQKDLESKAKIMAGTSFINEIKASTPEGFKPSLNASQPPETNLDLKFAHGYRCKDSRGNVKYASDGNIVYPCAALGVVHNKNTGTQDFFNLH